MHLSLDTILNLIVAALLVGTMIFAYVLNNRLKKLRSNKEEVDSAILRFDQSVTRAEETIVFLRDVSGKSYTSLSETVQKAQALRDEISFMLERGEGLAQSLDDKIRMTRRDLVSDHPKPSPALKPNLQSEAHNANMKNENGDEDRILALLKQRENTHKSEMPQKPVTKAEESLMDMLRTAR